MKLMLSAAMLTLLFTFSASAQNKSVYTSTKAESCRTIKSNPDEGGDYLGECRGINGYKLQIAEGELRQVLDVITPSKKKFELIKWGLVAGFSAVGEKVEWRTKNGVPVALITRYNVADGDAGKSKSYLLVSKIGKTSSCLTDIVDPMAKQNEEARKLADASSTKPCKEDR